MHHLIYCKSDSFIYNEETARERNFGRDPYLQIGSVNLLTRTTRTGSNDNTGISGVISTRVTNFTGIFTGSLCGSGSVTGSIDCDSSYSIGGLCEPLWLTDEDGNPIIDDSGSYIGITIDSDFFIFP